MDLIRQYIVQCITSAANNLRLNTEKIEVVALIRENIIQAADIETEIRNMKKVTELSTFAIRLSEIFNYIAKNKVDFFKISDKIKEHSYSLVKDMNLLLERLNPQSYKQLMSAVSVISEKVSDKKPPALIEEVPSGQKIIPGLPESAFRNVLLKDPVNVPEPALEMAERKKPDSKTAGKETAEENPEAEKGSNDSSDESEDNSILLFDSYEEKILNPIKELDLFLKNLAQNKASHEEMEKYYVIMLDNAKLSKKIGFDIIAGMHKIFAKTLRLMIDENFPPNKDTIGGMRAALIVIVAVIRGKEVDLTGYLNKAEQLGKKIQNIK